MGRSDSSSADIRDYAAAATNAKLTSASEISWSAERSDSRTEWAIRTNHALEQQAARLSAWSQDPSSIIDDSIEVPTRDAFASALRVIALLKQGVMDRVYPPFVMLPNLAGTTIGGGGEIDIEFVLGENRVNYVVEPNGKVMCFAFQDNKLTSQWPIDC